MAYLVEVNDSISQTLRREGCLPCVTGCRGGEGTTRLHILCVIVYSLCNSFGGDCTLSGLQRNKALTKFWDLSLKRLLKDQSYTCKLYVPLCLLQEFPKTFQIISLLYHAINTFNPISKHPTQNRYKLENS